MRKLLPQRRRTLVGTSLLGLVLAALIWTGCSDEQSLTAPENTLDVQERSVQVAKAIEVQDRHTPELMSRPGVVGTATRLAEDGTASIVLYVTPAAAAKRAELPQTLDDVSVTIVETGMFVAFDPDDPQTKERPAPNGFSVGHPDITAGTIGAAVTDGSNIYILSNNHVLANSNSAQIGDPALQPGPYDGGTSADQLGTLYDFEPISFDTDNTMDAAVALVDGSDVTYSTPSSAYGAPGTNVTTASVGMAVQKFGRTTGHTLGEVTEVNVTVSVCYETRGPFNCAQAATFVDQIGIGPGSFSDGGDSGSLIVTDDNNKNPVGLLFAGSDTRTLANPIDAVFDRFGVSIATGDGGGGTTDDPPTADFTYSVTDLTADFTDQSTDDGTIVSWSWDVDGDGTEDYTTQNPSHTYDADGTYTVTLTVTDDAGQASSASQDVTVSSSNTGGISLSATGNKVRGRHQIDLTWSGATSTDVDVYRNGTVVATTPNDGAYTDATDNRGGGSYTHQVCEAGTSTCSNEVTTTF